FDNGLKVLDAEVKKDETANNGEKNTTVVLSTTNLKHGITYNLIRFKRSSVSVEVISAEDEKDQGSNVPAPNPPKNQVHKGNIEEITDDNLTIDGKTYKVADSLNGFFQASNNEALQDAKIEIVSKNRVIQKVNGLTLNNSGTADKNLVIDGNDTIIDGPVTVNGDYYQINHLTVNGDLTLEEGVQNSFISDHLEVKGTTRAVDSSTIQSFSDSANFFTTASERENPKSRLTIVVKDSTMATIEIGKKDIYLSATGSTKVTEIKLEADSDIFANENVIIPKVSLYKGATNVELNATIQDVIIESNDDVVLSGKGNFDNV